MKRMKKTLIINDFSLLNNQKNAKLKDLKTQVYGIYDMILNNFDNDQDLSLILDQLTSNY